MAALIIAIFPQNSSRGNWEEQQDRTDPNSQFELARKPAWLLAFRQFGLPKWKHDFECRTFDHSDNSPCISTVFRALRKCKKNRQERYEILKFDPAKTLINQGFPAEKTAKANAHFESGPVWPLRYRSVSISARHSRRFRSTQKSFGEKSRRES